MFALLVPMLLGLLGKLPGMIGDYFQTQQQIKLAQITQQQQIQLQILQNQGQEATADSNRAIAVINAQTSYLRTFAYLVIAFPFVACMFNKVEYAQMLFNNLGSLPGWYTLLFTGLSCNMWGIPVPGSMMDSIANGISTAVHNNRAYRLAKNGIDPKVYFDAKRQAKGAPLTQQEVDEGNKELEVLNSGDQGETN
jgi:hypothetical protein